ncbi:MAG: hypothetical protein GQ582_09455, partial [Methyloprofundus sp.]|nr:hypothetical protein [Methyloprofundus sp.]
MTDKTVNKHDEIENLNRRVMLKGGVALSAGVAIAAVTGSHAVADSATTTSDSCTTVEVDPDYDDGQLLYRRNDGGEANGDSTQPIRSEEH